jgi:exoenzyme U
MTPGQPTDEMHDWVRDLFGVDPRTYGGGRRGPATAGAPGDQPGKTAGGKKIGVGGKPLGGQVGREAADPAIWIRAVGRALTKDGPGKPGARITEPIPTGPITVCKALDGKEISIAKAADGRVAMTREPPPVREITFSGGGGKGTALPGAVQALEDTGVLLQAKELHGASVGSMTAALLAAGMTAADLKQAGDTIDFSKVLASDHTFPIEHDGMGLEALVRDKMKSAINKQIAAFAEAAMARGKTIDPKTQDTLAAMSAKFATGAGPTFGDLRTLSTIIPAIKEVVISGTLIGTAPPSEPGKPREKIKQTKPEVRIFSADTEPDLEVAQVVHASAALPPVFKPVDLKLHDGSIARFEDGGVLNNAPSSDTTGTDRDVDPVPSEGKMTFLFGSDQADAVAKGAATPDRNRIGDLLSGAEFSAAEFANNSTLAERTEDVVVVPLKFTRHDGKKEDYTGFKGTLAFDMNKQDAVQLQGMSEAATRAYVGKQRQPETRSFASDAQMLNCVPRADLATLAGSDYPGAKDTLAFRDEVTASVAKLEQLAAKGSGAGDPEVRNLLEAIDASAQGDQERVGFIGRALNASGKLDGLLASARGAEATGIAALDAGIAVNAVIEARATARKILGDLVYPKMVRSGKKGVEAGLLKQMNQMLRNAKSNRDISRALTVGIDYYTHKVDLGGLLGNGRFAAELRAHLPKTQ